MSRMNQVRIPARLVAAAVATASIPFVYAHAISRESRERPGYGGPENAIEIALPPEVQARIFHSLPIAGLVVTPDTVAQPVLMNPRVRAAAGQPSSGKGAALLIDESGVVGTRAELFD